MTPHPVWFYTLVNAEEHGLGVRYRRRDDGRVRRGADDRLRDALNELGRVQRQLVVREGPREGERGRVAEEGVEDDRHVLARALEVRGVARRRDGHAADDAHHLECLLE